MKRFVSVLAVSVMTLFCFASATFAEIVPVDEVELYGVKLKGANREDMRKALLQAGLTPSKNDKSNEWADYYEVNGQFADAYGLCTAFDPSTGEFAFATYLFPLTDDLGHTKRLYDVFLGKYGEPESADGHVELGAATVKWQDPSGQWGITLRRNWPVVESSVWYANWPVFDRYKAWANAQDANAKPMDMRAQSNAF
jgi:hypothetical protein